MAKDDEAPIGTRVRVLTPVDKLGTITAYENVEFNTPVGMQSTDVPTITCDDGMTISGMECWWAVVSENESVQ